MKKKTTDQPLPKTIGKQYVSVYDATLESGASERTIRRWIKSERIHAIYDKTGHVRVALDDVLAHAKISSKSPLWKQVQRLQEKITEIDHLSHALSYVEGELRRWQDEWAHVREPLSPLQTHQSEPQGSPQSEESIPQGPGSRLHELEQRGTIHLETFCVIHRIPYADMRRLKEEGKIHLTRGPNSPPEQPEWWVTSEQRQEIMAYYNDLGLRYKKCPKCPHTTDQEEEDHA